MRGMAGGIEYYNNGLRQHSRIEINRVIDNNLFNRKKQVVKRGWSKKSPPTIILRGQMSDTGRSKERYHCVHASWSYCAISSNTK